MEQEEGRKERTTPQYKENKLSYIFILKLRSLILYFKRIVTHWAYSLDWKKEEGLSFARIHKAVSFVLVARHL